MRAVKELGIAAAAVVMCAASALAELKPVSKVVAQPAAPVKITEYSAKYERRTTQYTQEGIHHFLRFENASGKPIDAVQFGFVSFDVWNQFLTRMNGLTTDTLLPGKNARGEWVDSAYADFSLLTGVAYVSKVRFGDGEVWAADTREILDELRKIEKDFDADVLKKKETTDK